MPLSKLTSVTIIHNKYAELLTILRSNKMLFTCVFLMTPLAFILVNAVPSKPLLFHKYGPLYRSVQLLIENESIYASHLWNESLYQINDYAHLVQDAIDTYNTIQATVYERLDEISILKKPPIYQKCFKQYEREVAHFTRELYAKYSSCLMSLMDVMDTFELQLSEEAKFMSTAALRIGEIEKFCKISKLKRNNGNQAGIVLCVVTQIGAINQRLERTSELSVDLLLNLAIGNFINNEESSVEIEENPEEIDDNENGKDLLTENCLDYNDLCREFELVYAQILACQDNGKLNWIYHRNYKN